MSAESAEGAWNKVGSLVPMELRDVPFYNAVRNECRVFLHTQRTFTLQESATWFVKERPPFLMALLGGLPIGYCRIQREGDEATIGMDIHVDFRGRGLARPIYKALMARLADEGVKNFRLFVLKTNARAAHLYAAIGFVVVAETDIDYEMELRRGT